MTCRNGVETYHIKMFNELYSSHIFKQNHLFFIIQDCDNQRKALFYLKVLLGKNFPQFDKIPDKYTKGII